MNRMYAAEKTANENNKQPSEVDQWLQHLHNLLVELEVESQDLWEATKSVRNYGPAAESAATNHGGPVSGTRTIHCSVSEELCSIGMRIHTSIDRIRSTRTDLCI